MLHQGFQYLSIKTVQSVTVKDLSVWLSIVFGFLILCLYNNNNKNNIQISRAPLKPRLQRRWWSVNQADCWNRKVLSWRLKPCSESESVMFAGRLFQVTGALQHMKMTV